MKCSNIFGLLVFALIVIRLDWLYYTTWTVFTLGALTLKSSACYDHNWWVKPLFTMMQNRDPLSPIPAQVPPTTQYNEDYSYEMLRRLSEDFSEPAVVENMYPGLSENITIDWVKSILMNHEASVISTVSGGEEEYNMNCNGQGTMRKFMKIGDAIDKILSGEDLTIVAPGLARVQKGGLSFEEPIEAIYNFVDLGRMGGKLADPDWKAYSKQFWISRGDPTHDDRVGTGMHADMCASFTIQISGEKKWVSYHPEQAHHFRPTVRYGSPVAYADMMFKEKALEIPRVENVMKPGDMMYMPAFYWHRVHLVNNDPSVSITIRDCVIKDNLRYMSTTGFCLHTLWSMINKTPERVINFAKQQLGLGHESDGYFKNEEKWDL